MQDMECTPAPLIKQGSSCAWGLHSSFSGQAQAKARCPFAAASAAVTGSYHTNASSMLTISAGKPRSMQEPADAAWMQEMHCHSSYRWCFCGGGGALTTRALPAVSRDRHMVAIAARMQKAVMSPSAAPGRPCSTSATAT